MKNIMTNAWKIAKEGASKFGGKAVEYFAEALKIAWANIKNVAVTYTASIEDGKRGLWIAKITGTHPTYKMDREFLKHDAVDGYWLDFYLKDGLYSGKFSNASAQYFIVENGEVESISQSRAQEIANAM